MGLERHIENVLEKEGCSYKRGHHYYFEFGLKTESKEIAEHIAEILNDSGEFAPFEVFYQGGLDIWGIRFKSLDKKEH